MGPHLDPQVGQPLQRLQGCQAQVRDLPAALQVEAAQGQDLGQRRQAAVAHVGAVLQGDGREEGHRAPLAEAFACTPPQTTGQTVNPKASTLNTKRKTAEAFACTPPRTTGQTGLQTTSSTSRGTQRMDGDPSNARSTSSCMFVSL